MTARAIMVLGCTSGAGKSWLATALCRWYRRRGHDVAPFKAQNMSNHARVVALAGGGTGEIGSAQYFQALAAGIEPTVEMNPVLIKPEAGGRSQVVALGQVDAALGALPWRARGERLWPIARQALDALGARHDLLVIEGAGSPAEINLAADDYVNTRTALHSAAGCLLLADIDRGGAFAHLYGTHALMDAGVRSQLRGFVMNRFRGDPAWLAPGPAQLEELTGVPVIGVVPHLYGHGLPEEDAVPQSAQQQRPQVVVIACPHASNLDEFESLRRAGVRVAFATDRATVADAQWLVLPGSKHTLADLAWLRSTGLDEAVRAHARNGLPLLGICGGLQLLGERIEDPQGLEGGQPANEPGLSLLPLRTRFEADKLLVKTQARFGTLHGAWAALSGIEAQGYEIRLGRSARARGDTEGHDSEAGDIDSALRRAGDAAAIGWQQQSVLGVYLHGLFENPAVVAALFGVTPQPIDTVFDQLADTLDEAFAPGVLDALAGPAC